MGIKYQDLPYGFNVFSLVYGALAGSMAICWT